MYVQTIHFLFMKYKGSHFILFEAQKRLLLLTGILKTFFVSFYRCVVTQLYSVNISIELSTIVDPR